MSPLKKQAHLSSSHRASTPGCFQNEEVELTLPLFTTSGYLSTYALISGIVCVVSRRVVVAGITGCAGGDPFFQFFHFQQYLVDDLFVLFFFDFHVTSFKECVSVLSSSDQGITVIYWLVFWYY